MKKRIVKSGEVLFNPGDPADSFFLLMQGKVRFQPSLGFPEADLNEPVFGLSAPLIGAPRGMQAVAQEETVLIEFPFSRESLEALSLRSEKIRNNILYRCGSHAEQLGRAILEFQEHQDRAWKALVAALDAAALTPAARAVRDELVRRVGESFPDPFPPPEPFAPGRSGVIELLPNQSLYPLADAYRLELGCLELRLLTGETVMLFDQPGVCLAPLKSFHDLQSEPLTIFSLFVAAPTRLEYQPLAVFRDKLNAAPALVREVLAFIFALIPGLATYQRDLEQQVGQLREWLAGQLPALTGLPAPVAAALAGLGVNGAAAAPAPEAIADAVEMRPLAALYDALQQTPEQRAEIDQLLGLLRNPGSTDQATIRARMTNRFWELAAGAGAARAREEWHPQVRDLLRFGLLDEGLLQPGQLARLAAVRGPKHNDIFTVDEWLEGIATQEINPTSGDELAIRKIGVSEKLNKARGRMESEWGLLGARMGDWQNCYRELGMHFKAVEKGTDTFNQMLTLFNQQKAQLKAVEPLLDRMRTATDLLGSEGQRVREKLGKMHVNEGRIIEGIRNYAAAQEELNATRASVKGGDTTAASADSVIAEEVNTIIRQMAKMCIGPRGNHNPVLMGEFLTPAARELVTKSDLERLITEAAVVDPGIFQRQFKGVTRTILPYFIIIPCLGEKGVCWEPFERNNRATGRGRMAIPLVPRKDLKEIVFAALGDYRWQMAREAAAHYWMEEGITGKFYQYFMEAKLKGDIKELFVRNYVLWQLFEANGIQKMEKEIRMMFWMQMPFPAELKEQLKNRGFHYQQLYTADKNKERSSGY